MFRFKHFSGSKTKAKSFQFEKQNVKPSKTNLLFVTRAETLAKKWRQLEFRSKIARK